MGDGTSRSLEAHATAFAQILAATDDADIAFRQAAALADGLFPHQVEGVAFLLGRRRAILADDMGLGKTRQALAALSHAAPVGQVLVVCPASVKRNWAREKLMRESPHPRRVMEFSTRGPGMADDALRQAFCAIRLGVNRAHEGERSVIIRK
jgi:SNF2 family DNA or RNA helicase